MKRLFSILILMSYTSLAYAERIADLLCTSTSGKTKLVVQEITNLGEEFEDGPASASMFLLKFDGRTYNQRYAMSGNVWYSAEGRDFDLVDTQGYSLQINSPGGLRSSITVDNKRVELDCK